MKLKKKRFPLVSLKFDYLYIIFIYIIDIKHDVSKTNKILIYFMNTSK
jgi:hypothetical protein